MVSAASLHDYNFRPFDLLDEWVADFVGEAAGTERVGLNVGITADDGRERADVEENCIRELLTHQGHINVGPFMLFVAGVGAKHNDLPEGQDLPNVVGKTLYYVKGSLLRNHWLISQRDAAGQIHVPSAEALPCVLAPFGRRALFLAPANRE